MAENYLENVDSSWKKEDEFEEVEFKFSFHQTTHELRDQTKKHSYHKHHREKVEKSISVKFKKDSPPTKGEFCNKCMGRGHRGSILNMKNHRIQYIGPKFCKCASKYMHFESDESTETVNAV